MARWLRRRVRPPAALLAAIGDGERVVSWADTASGALIAATPRGLWWPDDPPADPPDAPRLIGWQFIDKAVWRDGVLVVVQADVVDDVLLVDRAPVAARLAVPRDLPPTVRRRVEANIVRTEQVAVGGGAVRFVGRRIPGRDGVTWWARLEGGAADTEQVRAAVLARLDRLRAEAAAATQ